MGFLLACSYVVTPYPPNSQQSKRHFTSPTRYQHRFTYPLILPPFFIYIYIYIKNILRRSLPSKSMTTANIKHRLCILYSARVVPGRGDEVMGMRNRCGRWGLVEVGAEGVVGGC